MGNTNFVQSQSSSQWATAKLISFVPSKHYTASDGTGQKEEKSFGGNSSKAFSVKAVFYCLWKEAD